MAPATIPTALPLRVIAGDTWRWDRTVDGYTPADGWTFKTFFRGAGKLDVTGVAATGNGYWELTASASSTKALAAGQYQVTEVVTNGGGERYVVGRGVVSVEANPESQVAGDGAPWEETAIVKLQAFLNGTLDAGILESQIAGRVIKLMSPSEAMQLIDNLQDRIARRRSRGKIPPLVPVFRRVG
jgi:hypothetical protein